MKPLSKVQFADALHKGLGRSVMHVREHAAAELRDVILDACVHNRAYDPQSEGSRTDWLVSILDLTGDEAYYRDRIIDAAKSVADWHDAEQVADLCLHFVRRGSDNARRAIYEIFERQHDEGGSWDGAERIVKLDGVAGMVRVAEVRGAQLRENPEPCEDDSLISLAADELGREAVTAALNARAQTSANVRAYLSSVEESTRLRESRSGDRSRPTPEEILAGVETAQPSGFGRYSFLAKDFSEEQIARAFSLLLGEKRRIPLLRYLALFWRRPMPRIEQRLFDLAESDDADIMTAAIRALAGTRDDSIRDFAVRVLRERPSLINSDAIELFAENYRAGDHMLIEAVLPSLEDPDALNSVGMDLLKVADKPGRPELAKCVAWLYERTPCSLCRGRAFERLVTWNSAPDTMVQECLFDCNEETRKRAEDLLRDTP